MPFVGLLLLIKLWHWH